MAHLFINFQKKNNFYISYIKNEECLKILITLPLNNSLKHKQKEFLAVGTLCEKKCFYFSEACRF
jgi:hypothetical protein